MKTYSVTRRTDVEAPGTEPLLYREVCFFAEFKAGHASKPYNLRAELDGKPVPLEHFSSAAIRCAVSDLRIARLAEDASPSPSSAERQLRRDFFIAAALPEAMRQVGARLIVVNDGEEPQDAVARVACEAADAVLARDAGLDNVRAVAHAAAVLDAMCGPTTMEAK